MTEAILIPALVAAAACFSVVFITHAIIHLIRKVSK